MEYLIIVIVLVVLALIAGGALLVRGRRRPGRVAEPPQAPPGAPAAPPGQDVDAGAGPAAQIVGELRTQVRVGGTRGTTEVRSLLRKDLIEQIGVDMDRSLRVARHGDRPAVVLMVGVNGTGKTSTCGKLARALIGEGSTVLLGAADTFRAAAADQLQTWGQRVGAQVIRSDREGADPASVAFEAVREGISEHTDTVIVDTAGRLHTKTGLMA